MTNQERDALLIKMSQKIFNGLDNRMECVEKELHQTRKLLWGVLASLLLLFGGVIADLLLRGIAN